MTQINTSMPADRVAYIKQLAKTEHKSFSKLLHELIEIGLKYYENDRTCLPPIKEEEYLAQIMRLSKETFKLLYDKEKFYTRNEGAEEAIMALNKKVKGAVERKYSGKHSSEISNE